MFVNNHTKVLSTISAVGLTTQSTISWTYDKLIVYRPTILIVGIGGNEPSCIETLLMKRNSKRKRNFKFTPINSVLKAHIPQLGHSLHLQTF